MMFKWIYAVGTLLALSVVPAWAVTSNGFDSDLIYVLHSGDASTEDPTDILYSHSKLTQVSSTDNWLEVGTPANTATSGTFYGHQFVSLTFSCSPTAGLNTPAGYRLFYLGRERSPDFLTYRPILVEVGLRGDPPVLEELREVYVGRIVMGDKDFGGTGVSVQFWSRGNLRYNPTNNTLMWAISHNGTGTAGTLHGYIYEFTLPDSPEGTGVGSPDETQGCTLMETYDTGITGTDAEGGFNINVAPNGTVYFRKPIASTNVYSFSTAGGATPGGTTTNPTMVVTGADLTTAAGNGIGNWQSAIYRPVSNSLVNLQRKTGGTGNSPFIVDYDLDTGMATRIEAYTWYRGQENGSLDPETGAIWIASQNWYDPGDMTGGGKGGGVRKYDIDGTLTAWDTEFALSIKTFDVAVPPGGPGACCKPTGGGCEVLSQEDCAAADGAWQGPATVCDESSCPIGACCGGCGHCEELPQADCAGGKLWMGPLSECGQVSCPADLCGTPAADANCDGYVDQTDFALFQVCLGLDPAVHPTCQCFDLVPDSNNIIDNYDLASFELCASGPGILAQPGCAN
jgi:hypothetical protein